MRFFALYLALAATTVSLASGNACTNAVKCDTSVKYFDKIDIKHAKTISKLKFSNTSVDFTITDSSNAVYPYRLVRCGCDAGSVPADTQVINVPPRRLHVADGPTIGMFTHSIQVLDRVVAVENPMFIYSRALRRITKPTPFTALNTTADVDVSFINFDNVNKYIAAKTGKPFFVNGESDEGTPFGRSEWIKIFGLMFDKVEAANSAFQEIVTTYTTSKNLANGARRRPSVVLNYPFVFEGVSWSQPSEGQYITQLLRDANVDYHFMNDGANSTHQMSLVQVREKFKWARYLINTGKYPPSKDKSMTVLFADESTKEGKQINELLKDMAAVRCANVWVNQKRFADNLANDYFEWGATRPDIILRDMVHMFHPNIDIGVKPEFSFKLDDAPANVKGGNCPYNDLLGEAKKNMVYVDTVMNISGMDRFEVENMLVEKIIPEVANDSKIDAKAIDGFFEKPPTNGSTSFVLRTMVKKGDVDSLLDNPDTVVSAVRAALGSNATVKRTSTVTADGVQVVNSRSGLGGGAIAGIVVGLIVFAIIAAFAAYVLAAKKGRGRAEREMRERYWEEHHVRLADDVEDGN